MPVPARFHQLRDRSQRIVDQMYAEPVQVVFFANSRIDPNRNALDIEAPLRVGGGKETNLGGGTAKSWRTKLAAGKAELHVDRTVYPDLKIKKGDRVKAVSRPGEPWFEVLLIDDRGDTRLVVQLGEL